MSESRLYRVKPFKSPGWKNYQRCRLDVSIGNEKLTGEKLGSIIDWISRNFIFCMVNIGDSLHRHNLVVREGLSMAQAHEKANYMGQKWIDDNASYLSEFSIPYKVSRWDEWLTPEMQKTYKNIVSS